MNIEEDERVFRCAIIPHGTWEDFNKTAQIIEQNLGIKFKKKSEHLEAYYWTFDFEGVEINLHCHEMFGDVELFTDKKDAKDKRVLTTLVEQLKSYMV